MDGDDVSKPDEMDKPVCKSCNKSVSVKRSNTTNLHAHLKDNHPDAYAEVQRENTAGKSSSFSQPTLAEVFHKNTWYDPKSMCAQ